MSIQDIRDIMATQELEGFSGFCMLFNLFEKKEDYASILNEFFTLDEFVADGFDLDIIKYLSDKNVDEIHKYLRPNFVMRRKKSFEENTLGASLNEELLTFCEIDDVDNDKLFYYFEFLQTERGKKYWECDKHFIGKLEYSETSEYFDTYYKLLCENSLKFYPISKTEFTIDEYIFDFENYTKEQVYLIQRESIFYKTFYKHAVHTNAQKLEKFSDSEIITYKEDDSLSVIFDMFNQEKSDKNKFDIANFKEEMLKSYTNIVAPANFMEQVKSKILEAEGIKMSERTLELKRDSPQYKSLEDIPQDKMAKMMNNMEKINEMHKNNPNLTKEDIIKILYNP